MAEALYGWVKNIIYYVIFLSLVSNLLAGTSYEKYIRFFAGLVLVLLVVSPLTGKMQLQEELPGLFEQFTLKSDAQELTKKLWGMEERQLEATLEKYGNTVSQEIKGLAEAEGFVCEEASVSLETDRESGAYGQVKEVRLVLGEKKEEPEDGTDKEQGEPVAVAPVEIGKVAVTDASEAGEAADASADISKSDGVPSASLEAAAGLKGKVEAYYGLEEAQIKIQWKND